MISSFHKIKQGQIGYTLIELMVALLISVVLLSAVSGTYVWSTRNYLQDDNAARMQENARYALDAITQDLLMADFMHGVFDASSIDTSAVSLGGTDCGVSGETWAIDLSQPIQMLSKSTTSAVNTAFSCIPTGDLHKVGPALTPFTDVLAIKRVKGVEGGLVNGKLYVQTNLVGAARMIDDGTTLLGAEDWEYQVSIYYISTNTPGSYPTLYRKTLQGENVGGTNSLQIATEDGGVAEGIEYFHIMYGIDHEFIDGLPETLADGNANYYLSSPTDAQLAAAVTAKIYVLARTRNDDRWYEDNKQYNLGDVTLGGFNDEIRRKVFSTTIKLRNRVIQNTALSVIPNA